MGRKKKPRHTVYMITHVKSARKAQGQCRCGKNINKGDEYYWHKNRYGPKVVRCPDCPFRRSETVSSDKLSTLYAAQEALQDSITAVDELDDPKQIYDDLHAALEVEKDALRGIVGGVAGRLDVRYFSCRGYVSISEVWNAAQRIIERERAGKKTVILHLGDHDPSGIDMTRDIEDRLRLFKCAARIERIALNMDQIRRYNFPPNPAKVTDSRYESYRQKYGDQSWELDAIDPALLVTIVETGVRKYLVQSTFDAAVAKETIAKKGLRAIAEKYTDVLNFIRGQK